MKRGIVQLSSQEALLLQEHLTEIAHHHPLTWEKLVAASQQSAQSVNIQLSEEEAEMMLDLLPPPTMSDSTDLKQARLRLQQFVQTL